MASTAGAPTLRAASVRVPGSTSNLGAGFDSLGLALDRYLDAAWAPGSGPLRLERAGTLAALPIGQEDDTLLRAFRAGLRRGGVDDDPGGTLRARSEIPTARGLGSSAAARVAGTDLARAVVGRPVERQRVFRHAMEAEGHGDNAAPSTFGGLVSVVQGPDGPISLPLPLSNDVGFAFAAPAAGLSTDASRSTLPSTVTLATATAGLGRMVALVRGLATADPELLRVGVYDELHVPHRLPLIPGAYNGIGAGYDAGAWAVTISGGGSGLIALCDPSHAEDVADAMRVVFQAGGDDGGCVAFALRPDLVGLQRG